MSATVEAFKAVRIPHPEAFPRARGVNATSALEHQIKTRVNPVDFELVTNEARQLNLSVAMFVRWVVLHTARALKEAREGVRVSIEL